jgi:hypothetical protein
MFERKNSLFFLKASTCETTWVLHPNFAGKNSFFPAFFYYKGTIGIIILAVVVFFIIGTTSICLHIKGVK